MNADPWIAWAVPEADPALRSALNPRSRTLRQLNGLPEIERTNLFAKRLRGPRADQLIDEYQRGAAIALEGTQPVIDAGQWPETFQAIAGLRDDRVRFITPRRLHVGPALAARYGEAPRAASVRREVARTLVSEEHAAREEGRCAETLNRAATAATRARSAASDSGWSLPPKRQRGEATRPRDLIHVNYREMSEGCRAYGVSGTHCLCTL